MLEAGRVLNRVRLQTLVEQLDIDQLSRVAGNTCEVVSQCVIAARHQRALIFG